MDDSQLFFGSSFVSAQTIGGEGHSMGSGASGIDPDNFQFSQVFAESNDLSAEHTVMALDPDNLRFSDYYAAAGPAATTEPILPAGSSNPDESAKENQHFLNAFEGIP